MEEATDFPDWEVLHVPDSVIAAPAPETREDSAPRAGGDSDGVIRPAYCGLNTDNWYVYYPRSSDGDRDDPDRVDPNSGSGFPDETSREGLELGLAAAKFPRSVHGGLWTPDVSSGGKEMPLQGHAKGELVSSAGSQSELVLEGVNLSGGVGEGEGAFVGGTEETGVVEAGSGVPGELDSASDSPNITVEPESPVERSGDGDLQNLTVPKVEKAGMVWWKLPMEILKFCVFRIRPVWSISIAVALAGALILGRRLYKKKPKSRSIPLKVSVDDKKVSQLMVRAIRLNEALSVVKQVPVIRSTLPAAGVTPWPVVALR